MNIIKWKCMACEDIMTYKGLCRVCTEYDEDGNILNPVQRIRLNGDGTQWVAQADGPTTSTKEMQNMFRGMRQRKPSKKQRRLMAAELKELAKAKKEMLETSEDMVEFGENVEEE